MSHPWFSIVLLVAAIGSAMIAGLFYAFSTFIMQALGRLPTAAGAAAMQSINTTILNPLFFSLFFGTAAASLIVSIGALLAPERPGALCVIIGGALYLAGAIVVTMAFNVPLNNGLAGTNPAAAECDAVWRRYLVRWTQWNHVRTLASLAAAVLLTIGLCAGR
jgi:uncharacterized membrane protein